MSTATPPILPPKKPKADRELNKKAAIAVISKWLDEAAKPGQWGRMEFAITRQDGVIGLVEKTQTDTVKIEDPGR